jgi:hypothetical protein
MCMCGSFLLQVSILLNQLRSSIHWSYWFWPLEADLEELGTRHVQILFMDGCSKQNLDSGSPGQKKVSPTRQPALFVIKLRKLLTTCWWRVFSPVRSGSLCCKCSTCKPWLHKTIFPSLSGGWLLVPEWMAWLRKVWTPSLSWEHGPSGSTATAASSMGFHPMFLVLFRSSRKSCTSGPLLGLEECHISSP